MFIMNCFMDSPGCGRATAVEGWEDGFVAVVPMAQRNVATSF